MYKHAAESFVAVAHAPNVAKKICTQVQDFCQSVATEGSSKFLTFEDGCAILLPTDYGLFFRVSAQNLVVFRGIQTVIEGSLSSFTAASIDVVEWLNADEPLPFDRQQSRHR